MSPKKKSEEQEIKFKKIEPSIKEIKKQEVFEEDEESELEEEAEQESFQMQTSGGNREFIRRTAPVIQSDEQQVENLEQFAKQVPTSSASDSEDSDKGYAARSESYSASSSKYSGASYDKKNYSASDTRPVLGAGSDSMDLRRPQMGNFGGRTMAGVSEEFLRGIEEFTRQETENRREQEERRALPFERKRHE